MARLHKVLLEYVRGQLLTSLFIGVVTAVGLRMLGLRMEATVELMKLQPGEAFIRSVGWEQADDVRIFVQECNYLCAKRAA